MKILILTVGTSPNPLIKSIKIFKPDKIFFIVSEQTLLNVGKIVEDVNFDQNNIYTEKVRDYEDLLACFETSHSMIKKAKEESSEIVVDFTGGTKPMSVGLLIASLNENCFLNYTGSSSIEGREQNGTGRVKDTYECMKEQYDPYKFFAVAELEKGMSFFNRYQFVAASENFKLAHSKTKDKRLKEKFSIFFRLSEIYSLWDKFVENKGRRLDDYLEKIVTRIKKFSALTDEEFEFIEKLEDNTKFLKNKLGKDGSDAIEYYVIDLINNAERRWEEGKFDDALARLYRAFELIAQSQFNDLNLMNIKKINEKKEFSFVKKKFKESFDNKLYEQILDKYERKNRTLSTSGLYEYYDLLKLIGEDIGHDFMREYSEENSVLKSSLSSRNKSILAHGLNPVPEETVKILFDKTLKLAKKNIDNFEEKREEGKFLKLF